jgi:predicted ArsR family transcriptional regulator
MTLQQRARALGDPTRHAIFRCLLDAGEPLGIADLTGPLTVSHHAVRQHLAKLVDAGLVLERRAAPSGPGRPRLVYEVDPAAAGPWSGSGPYERLSGLLLEIIRTGDEPEDVGRAAADSFRVPVPSGDALTDLHGAMARQGFEPEARTTSTRAEVVLHACPFATVALTDRHTVCGLHLGIAEGLVDGSPLAVDELVAKDPRRADCRIRLAQVDEERELPAPMLTLRR